ncbi:hypothetical protein [Thermococcus prieurii]
MSPIKVKTLTRQIIALADELGLKAVPEYRTRDGTRIDVAILDGEKKLLAIELEASFKWFPQRVLYDVVKAHRAGFPELWIITPFQGSPGWVVKYAEEVGLILRIMGEERVLSKLRTFLPSGT